MGGRDRAQRAAGQRAPDQGGDILVLHHRHDVALEIAAGDGVVGLNALEPGVPLGVGDAVFFVAGKPKDFVKFAGLARTKVGEELNLIAKDRFDLCWIVDFPMFEWNEEEKKIDFSHNPFSMPNFPVDEFLALDAKDDEKILGMKAIQYDIVCNGVELSSGAIRNHRPDVMKKAFAIAGYGEIGRAHV